MPLVLYPSETIGGTSLYKETDEVTPPPIQEPDVDDDNQLLSTIKSRIGRGFVRI